MKENIIKKLYLESFENICSQYPKLSMDEGYEQIRLLIKEILFAMTIREFLGGRR